MRTLYIQGGSGSSIFSIQFPFTWSSLLHSLINNDCSLLPTLLLAECLTVTGIKMVKGSEENVDELRQRLEHMKKLMAERKLLNGEHENRSESGGFIDGSLLSFVFGSALCVILTVSCYAFVNLFHAIAKKYTSSHDEL